MNKKTAVALAVGAVFSTPVLAQTGSSVQIYGKLYPELVHQKSFGASTAADVTATLVAGDGNGVNHKGRFSVDTQNSYVGFRGREMLGGGLNAIWQIETRTRFDTGTGNPWAGGRNSFLGLQGGFGTVKLGNMDTIYKEYGAQVGSFFGVSSGNVVSSSAILSTHGLGTDGGAGFDETGFHVRAPNSIQYETPEFGDFQAGIQFMPDEAKGNPTRPGLNSNLLSMGVKYEAGPLYVSVQHERHNDWLEISNQGGFALASTATGSKDTATRFSATYELMKAHKLAFDISQMEWRETGGAAGEFDKLKKRTWAVGWAASWGGPWRTELTYVRSNEGSCSLVGGGACSTDGLDANMISAGVGYTLSKRTLLFGLATRLDNGKSALFSQTNNFDPNRGADTSAFAVGMSHSF